MIRWIRRVVPIEYLAVFAVLFVLAEGIDRIVQIVALDFSLDPRPNARLIILLAGCVIYGVYRAIDFHPALRPEYREWLIRTPWTRGAPLPVGPVYVVWQDAFFAGLAVLLAYYVRSPHVYWPGVLMVSGYVGTLTFSFRDHRLRPFMYLVLLGLGMIIRFYDVMPVVVASALVIFAVVCMGLSRSLELLRSIELKSLSAAIESSNQREAELGWPFNRLKPGPEVHLDRSEAIYITILFAWWIYILQRFVVLAPDDGTAFITVRLLYGIPLVAVLAGRVYVYCHHHRSPISILGRIGTGRLIIPAYDKVFVAPLLALGLGLVLPLLLLSLGFLRYYAYPIAAVPTMGLIFSGGPSLHEWRLTGRHRIVPAMFNSRTHEKL